MAEQLDQLRELRKYLRELAYLDSAGEILDWDQYVNMPSNHLGHSVRADVLANLAGLSHSRGTSSDLARLLDEARDKTAAGLLNEDEQCIVARAFDDFENRRKIPRDFIEEQAKLTSESQQVWEEARAKSDFVLFRPYLERIVALERQGADYTRTTGQTCYEALLCDCEPGCSVAKLNAVFQELKSFLVPFVDRITLAQSWIKPEILRQPIAVSQQARFARMVAKTIGYRLEAGRIDTSVHPMSTSFHPTDCRITVRYNRTNFINDCLMSLMHESGHAMYEQGLRQEFFGTPLAESVSLGIHESQSRLWENLVGHSIHFWVYFYPKLQKAIPYFRAIPLADFYGAINHVQPSFIRVDADEVTYNLHIILRFELEKALIDGEIEVRDLPDLWNAKFKEMFGLEVKKDSDGILQDVHWSDGSFGYFPTYALGNIYASQFYSAALRDIPSLELMMSQGNFADLLEWLRINIHCHGRRYLPGELVFRATGEGFSPEPFFNYLQKKYSQLYNLPL